MQKTVKERLIEYLSIKSIGRNKFEKMAGISLGYITNLKNAPKESHLVKILNAAPDLNKVWLLTGEGEMLVSDEKKVVPYYMYQALLEERDEWRDKCAEHERVVAELERRLSKYESIQKEVV